MNASQTVTTFWMYADARPSLEAAATTAIGSVAEAILGQLRRSALVLTRSGVVSRVRGRK